MLYLNPADVTWVLNAHAGQTRKHDKATPYAAHPIWAATTLLHETALPPEVRNDGAAALLYHDLLEDTDAGLPPWASETATAWAEELTFHGGFAEERERIWERSIEAKLLKLYDKASNLLDGAWMKPAKRAAYLAYTERLAAEVEAHYGPLNITRLLATL